eukprot:365174-Chlamydomonas_euryale.AAC.4
MARFVGRFRAARSLPLKRDGANLVIAGGPPCQKVATMPGVRQGRIFQGFRDWPPWMAKGGLCSLPVFAVHHSGRWMAGCVHRSQSIRTSLRSYLPSTAQR